MRLLGTVAVAVFWSGAATAAIGGRGLSIAADTTLTYDDNVFRTAPGVTRGDHRSDWILSPGLTIGYARPVGPVSLSVSSSINYDFHRYNHRLNKERIFFDGKASGHLLFCDIAANVGYVRRQSDLGDIIGGGNLVNIEDRVNFGANLLCGSAVGLRPGLSYEHMIVNNSSSARSVSDFKNDSYTASIGYSRPALGLLSIYGSYTDGDYPNRVAIAPALFPNDRVKVYSTGLSFSRAIGSRLSGAVSVGHMWVKPRAGTTPGFKGLSYSGNLSFKGGQRISGTLGVSRAAQQSNLLGLSYTITSRYDANINYALTQSIGIFGATDIAHRRFAASSAIISPINGGSDRTWDVSGGIRFKTRRSLSFELKGSHTERKSKSALVGYDANRISFNASLKF